MSTFANNITSAFATLRSAAAIDVTYRRGADSLEIEAIPGQTKYESGNTDGLIEQYQMRDYTIEAAALIINGSVVLPEAGDQIVETDSQGNETVYELMSPGGDMPAWRFADHGRTHLRVHTKVVEGGR